MNRVLVTGATGQIGSDLVVALRQRYGVTQVIESSREIKPSVQHDALREVLDVTDRACLLALIDRYQIDTVYHLAGLLSAKGEQIPDRCWDVNVNGLRNVLEAAKRID